MKDLHCRLHCFIICKYPSQSIRKICSVFFVLFPSCCRCLHVCTLLLLKQQKQQHKTYSWNPKLDEIFNTFLALGCQRFEKVKMKQRRMYFLSLNTQFEIPREYSFQNVNCFKDLNTQFKIPQEYFFQDVRCFKGFVLKKPKQPT